MWFNLVKSFNSPFCASIKVATDVNIKPILTRPRAKAPPAPHPDSTIDATSQFNQSNPMPTEETTTKTETKNVINRCRLDVNSKPNSTRPGAKATSEIQPASITDDPSHFNLSNPTPTAETTTKIETPKILKSKIQHLTHPQQYSWYNPVRTEKDTRLTTARRLLQHYRDNNRDNTWYNPVCTEKEAIQQQEPQQEQQQNQQHNYEYPTYEQVKEQEEQQRQELRDRQNQHWDAEYHRQMAANGGHRSPDKSDVPSAPTIITHPTESSTGAITANNNPASNINDYDDNTNNSDEDPTATHKLTTAYYRKPPIVPVITKETSGTDNITTDNNKSVQQNENNNNSDNTWYTQVRKEKDTINIIEEEPTKTSIASKLEYYAARKKEKVSRQRKASKIARRKQEEEQQQEYQRIKMKIQGGIDPKYTELQHELTVLEQQNPKLKKRWEQQQIEDLRQQQEEDDFVSNSPEDHPQSYNRYNPDDKYVPVEDHNWWHVYMQS